MWCVTLVPSLVLAVLWITRTRIFLLTLRGSRGASCWCGFYCLAWCFSQLLETSGWFGAYCWLLAAERNCFYLSGTHLSETHTRYAILLYPPVFVRLLFSPSSYFPLLCHTSNFFSPPSSKSWTYCLLSFVLLPPHPSSSTRSPSSSSEPLEEHHVAQLLRRFSTDLSLGRHQLPMDRALANHLHQCSYHLRLFRNWLISGQDPIEYLHGQPLAPPSLPQPYSLINLCSRSPWDCACSVVDSCFAS